MKMLALVLAIVFLILAVLTFTGATNILPVLGLDGTHHTKHGIGYIILAILCFMWMRMSSGTTTIRR
ncbi:MAG: hypothetical protein NVSMB31_04440 [Vulcanimicrobiaceae bacterium]